MVRFGNETQEHLLLLDSSRGIEHVVRVVKRCIPFVVCRINNDVRWMPNTPCSSTELTHHFWGERRDIPACGGTRELRSQVGRVGVCMWFVSDVLAETLASGFSIIYREYYQSFECQSHALEGPPCVGMPAVNESGSRDLTAKCCHPDIPTDVALMRPNRPSERTRIQSLKMCLDLA